VLSGAEALLLRKASHRQDSRTPVGAAPDEANEPITISKIAIVVFQIQHSCSSAATFDHLLRGNAALPNTAQFSLRAERDTLACSYMVLSGKACLISSFEETVGLETQNEGRATVCKATSNSHRTNASCASEGIRGRRWMPMVALLLPVVVAVSVPFFRDWILRSAGWALVLRDQPIKSADIIVVSMEADGNGVLEASDLVNSGLATRVAVFSFTVPPYPADRELIRRGIPYDDRGTFQARQLSMLGIKTIEQIPLTTAGSESETDVLPDWCDQHGYRTIVVITSPDHSRRIARLLQRSMKDHSRKLTVRAGHYALFDPNHWWESHDGVRTEVEEFEKLLFDVARHPF